MKCCIKTILDLNLLKKRKNEHSLIQFKRTLHTQHVASKEKDQYPLVDCTSLYRARCKLRGGTSKQSSKLAFRLQPIHHTADDMIASILTPVLLPETECSLKYPATQQLFRTHIVYSAKHVCIQSVSFNLIIQSIFLTIVNFSILLYRLDIFDLFSEK